MTKTKAKRETVTAADVRVTLQRTLASKGAVLVYEVARNCGYDARRHLDAVLMELWPSRGQTLHGIEIKVSRADYMAEIRQPEKAEEIAEYLDFFSIAAPPGVVDLASLPQAWGYYERQSTTKLNQVKAPERTSAKPVDRRFLAAMLRAAGRGVSRSSLEREMDCILQERDAQLRDKFEQRVEQAARRITDDDSEAAKWWRELKAAVTSIDIGWISDQSVLDAVRLVHKLNLASDMGPVENAAAALRTASDRLEEALAQHGLEPIRQHRPAAQRRPARRKGP